MFADNTNNGFYMPVTPAYGGGYGMGGFGNDWAWIIILLLCGWGGGFGGMGGYGGGLGIDFPWLMSGQQQVSNNVNDGFRDQTLNTTMQGVQNSVTSGFGDVQTALCGGFAGVNATVNGAQNALSQQLYNNEIASLNRSFDAQTANMQGFNGVQNGIADLRYTEAAENCATRTAAANNTRDIIENQTRGTQAIIDKLCALELDGVKTRLEQAQRDNLSLQNQLNMATMRESQTAQNAFISQGFANEVDALYNRLNTCPVPTTPVYGRTPIFTCNNNGCGCNAA